MSEFLQGAKRLEGMYFSPIRQVGERAAVIAEQGHAVLPFSAGEPDFNTPTLIKEATIRAIEGNHTHYAPNRGVLALRKEISALLEETTGVKYDPATEILLNSGGAEALNNAVLSVVNPGDEVIVFSPAFMNYENLIELCSATMVDIPLRKEDGFQINLETLEQHISERTKMIIINNPCNPTGVVYHTDILEGVCKLAKQHDLVILSDEIYSQITYDQVLCPSIASFPDMKERTITMNGFSKAYAMTGWRLAYVAACPQMINNILKVHQYTTTCCPTFIQVGLAEAMNAAQTRQEMDDMVQAFDRRRRMMMAGLQEIPGIRYIEPKGAFYIFVDVSGTGLSGEAFASELLEHWYVACVPGVKLGRNCNDFVRFSYATSDENIQEGLRRVKALVKSLSSGKEGS